MFSCILFVLNAMTYTHHTPYINSIWGIRLYFIMAMYSVCSPWAFMLFTTIQTMILSLPITSVIFKVRIRALSIFPTEERRRRDRVERHFVSSEKNIKGYHRIWLMVQPIYVLNQRYRSRFSTVICTKARNYFLQVQSMLSLLNRRSIRREL